jgi:hypothetical protein
MSFSERRCDDCYLPVLGQTPSCPRCGGINLVLVGGPTLSDPVAPEKHAPAQHSPFDEEPRVRCVGCHQYIEAAQAYHSCSGGQAVCWLCKRAEEAQV